MSTLHRSVTLAVSIARRADEVYAYIRDVRHFPHWASSFCLSVREAAGQWLLATPDGELGIQFVADNSFGVLDHTVTPASGLDNLVPMRVVANGEGCEVLLTSFQLPGMTDSQFERDRAMMNSDLQTLKTVLESRAE